MSDFPTLLAYLKRTAMQSGYTMTVDRSMVLKLIAGAELAEADVACADTADPSRPRPSRDEYDALLAAYRKVTR